MKKTEEVDKDKEIISEFLQKYSIMDLSEKENARKLFNELELFLLHKVFVSSKDSKDIIDLIEKTPKEIQDEDDNFFVIIDYQKK